MTACHETLWYGPLESLTWQAISLAERDRLTLPECRAIFEGRRDDALRLFDAGEKLAKAMELTADDTAIALADVVLHYRESETWLRWLNARCSS